MKLSFWSLVAFVLSEASGSDIIDSKDQGFHTSEKLEDSDSPKRKRARINPNHDFKVSKLRLVSHPSSRSSSRSATIFPLVQFPGIMNMGATCYFSSLLQVTSHIPALTNLLSWINEQLEYPTGKLPSELRSYHELLSSFMRLVNDIAGGGTTPILPQEVFEAFRAAVPGGSKYQIDFQQDAEEALSDFINALNDGVNAIKEYSKPNTIPTDAIISLFRVHITNSKKCTVCSNLSNHNEPSSIITWLSIPKSSKIIPLESLFHSFASPELVEDVDCETCARKHNAVGIMTIVDPAPPVFLIGIKRFQWNGRKIMSKVSVPIHLDISTVSSATGLYELAGMIFHHGARIQSGHYTSQFLDPVTRSWIDANDSETRILPIGPTIEQSSDVYIMVYIRRRISNED